MLSAQEESENVSLNADLSNLEVSLSIDEGTIALPI